MKGVVEIKTPKNQNPSSRLWERSGTCFAELGSLTAAMKAQEALAAAAIPATVEKLESVEAPASHRGCVYGIRISCLQERNASAVLKHARIAVKRWNRED